MYICNFMFDDYTNQKHVIPLTVRSTSLLCSRVVHHTALVIDPNHRTKLAMAVRKLQNYRTGVISTQKSPVCLLPELWFNINL